MKSRSQSQFRNFWEESSDLVEKVIELFSEKPVAFYAGKLYFSSLLNTNTMPRLTLAASEMGYYFNNIGPVPISTGRR
jgi:hypothetical protein